jgi:cysteine desulfurase family protein (TIGR01976 family)
MMTTGEIRSHFPALSRLSAGHPTAYFDGPGGTQVPLEVVDAMGDYLLNHNANTHWKYQSSRETDDIIEGSRTTLSEFLNCSHDEVIFGANMTSLTFHLARSIGRSLSAGDEIIVTDLDHQANVAPWTALERDFGAVIKVVPMTLSGGLDTELFESMFSNRTRVVAVAAASNALGSITDLGPIISRAQAAGSLVFVDAVHFAPHSLVDFRRLGADFLACSPYKFYGPHLGVAVGRKELLDRLEVPRVSPAPNTSPERFETGTLSHEAIAGAAAAVDFMASIGEGPDRRHQLESAYETLHLRSTTLLRQLWEGLLEIRGVTLFGPDPDEPRTPTAAFTVDGVPSSEVATRLSADYGVFVSHGNFYASRVIETLGLQPEGLVRAGCACYTTSEEVDRLVAGVNHIASQG